MHEARYVLPTFTERTSYGFKELSPYTKLFEERIAFHTGQTVEQIEKDSDRDRWFTADEAKEYGFVDHVVTLATQVPSTGAVS